MGHGERDRWREWVRCASEDTAPDVAIKACTALIDVGDPSSLNLSALLMNRGSAYARQGDTDP
jgi:hypothetical protein